MVGQLSLLPYLTTKTPAIQFPHPPEQHFPCHLQPQLYCWLTHQCRSSKCLQAPWPGQCQVSSCCNYLRSWLLTQIKPLCHPLSLCSSQYPSRSLDVNINRLWCPKGQTCSYEGLMACHTPRHHIRGWDLCKTPLEQGSQHSLLLVHHWCRGQYCSHVLDAWVHQQIWGAFHSNAICASSTLLPNSRQYQLEAAGVPM